MYNFFRNHFSFSLLIILIICFFVWFYNQALNVSAVTEVIGQNFIAVAVDTILGVFANIFPVVPLYRSELSIAFIKILAFGFQLGFIIPWFTVFWLMASAGLFELTLLILRFILFTTKILRG